MTSSQQNSADAVTKYRGAMAGFLKSSLAFMGHTAGPQTGHPGLDADTKAELDRDSFHVFRLHAILLVRKARLHVIAVLIANHNSNLHSLAVQMRPALECVGQVVSVFHSLFIASDPDLVHQYPERRLPSDHAAPDQGTFRPRLSSGIDRQGRSSGISPQPQAPIRIRQGPGPGRRPSLVRLPESLPPPEARHARGPSFLGGVRSNNTPHDQLAFAVLLDYLAHQMLVMVAHAALSPTTDLDTDPFLTKVFARLAEKRAATRRHRVALATIFPTAEPTPQN